MASVSSIVVIVVYKDAVYIYIYLRSNIYSISRIVIYESTPAKLELWCIHVGAQW
jgi:hypothetical protein